MKRQGGVIACYWVMGVGNSDHVMIKKEHK